MSAAVRTDSFAGPSLAALGADQPVDPAVARSLDEDGYAVLPGVLAADELDVVRARLAELSIQEGTSAGVEVHQETGTDRLADLVNKGAVFEVFYSRPQVLAAVAHVLDGELKLSSLNSRAALPGTGHQALHADWGSAVGPDGYQVCNSIWLLDDFTAENGATRVVPGSHRFRDTPPNALDDPSAPHPDQQLLLGPAGTVVVFNSHLWHGGTQNRSNAPRRAVHSYFTRRHQPQQLDQAEYLRLRTWRRLTPAQRWLLDVDVD